MALGLRFDPQTLLMDIAVEDGVLATGDELKTAIFLSLLCDRRADDDDTLPAITPERFPDRRGWWADTYTGGDSFGSKWWLRWRSKATEETRLAFIDDARQALQWLIEDGVAADLEIEAEWQSRETAGVLAMRIVVVRPGGVREEFSLIWAEV